VEKLDQQSDKVKLFPMGPSDAATPAPRRISGDKDFNFESIHQKNKRVILINNGIHPVSRRHRRQHAAGPRHRHSSKQPPIIVRV